MLLPSRADLFSAIPIKSMRILLIPKLRSYLAEFLNDCYSLPLGTHLYPPVLVFCTIISPFGISWAILHIPMLDYTIVANSFLSIGFPISTRLSALNQSSFLPLPFTVPLLINGTFGSLVTAFHILFIVTHFNMFTTIFITLSPQPRFVSHSTVTSTFVCSATHVSLLHIASV